MRASVLFLGYGSHNLTKIPFGLCFAFAILSVIKEFFQVTYVLYRWRQIIINVLVVLTVDVVVVSTNSFFEKTDTDSTLVALHCFVLTIHFSSTQLLHRKLQYFCTVSTYLELIMYLCVFTFLANDEKSNRQLQAGAIAIFLGWINFTWFLKRFPTYGIYIIMAKKVFVTFLKVPNKVEHSVSIYNANQKVVNITCANNRLF